MGTVDVSRESELKAGELFSRRSWLRLTHLAVGVAGFLAFVETGQYMDARLGHLADMADAPRALYRSAHIFLLLCAQLHLLLGLYLTPAPRATARVVQLLGSLALFGALAGFLFGFYVETPLGEVERPVIRHSIYLSLAGVLIHGVAQIVTAAWPAAPDVG